MGVQAWPFLVSRNKSVGYRAVVAPDFMVEAQAVHLLADQTQGTITEAGTALCQEIHHDKVGKLTLIYRIARATEGDQSLTDGFGRPVNQIAGLVLKGAPEGAVVTEEHLQEAYKHLQEPFRDFWEQTAARPAFPSQAIDLQSISDKTTPLQFIKAESPYVGVEPISTAGKHEDIQPPQQITSETEITRRKVLKGTVVIAGVAFAGHGVYKAWNAIDSDPTTGDKRRNWSRTILHLGEAGLGTATIWTALVAGKQPPPHRR